MLNLLLIQQQVVVSYRGELILYITVTKTGVVGPTTC